MGSENIKRRTSPVTPVGINHLVLNVRDMAESHRFWSDLLGFEQVGALKPRAADDPRPSVTMQFYSGEVDGDVNHHDLALVESDNLPVPEDWSMYDGVGAINHIAITYPDRQSWLDRVQHLVDNGVTINRRTDHGMTHSVYINDPNGYGVEVLYELPEEVWRHDIDGALNYAVNYPTDEPVTDSTDYVTDFSRR